MKWNITKKTITAPCLSDVHAEVHQWSNSWMQPGLPFSSTGPPVCSRPRPGWDPASPLGTSTPRPQRWSPGSRSDTCLSAAETLRCVLRCLTETNKKNYLWMIFYSINVMNILIMKIKSHLLSPPASSVFPPSSVWRHRLSDRPPPRRASQSSNLCSYAVHPPAPVLVEDKWWEQFRPLIQKNIQWQKNQDKTFEDTTAVINVTKDSPLILEMFCRW